MINIPNQGEDIPEEIFEEAPSPKQNGEPQVAPANENGEDVKKEVNAPETGSMNEYPAYEPKETEEKIQEVAELIVDEKWDDMTKRIGNLGLWKSRVETEITSIKQEIFRMQNTFQGLQNAIAGKLDDYNKNIMNVNSEMKALEGVLQKILEPLSQNIRDLNKITNELKRKTKEK